MQAAGRRHVQIADTTQRAQRRWIERAVLTSGRAGGLACEQEPAPICTVQELLNRFLQNTMFVAQGHAKTLPTSIPF
jgi:hypothetical protein